MTSPYSSHWTSFVVDEARESASYLWKYTAEESPLSKQELDRWFDNLHPSKIPQAWTEAHYKGEKLLRKTAWTVLDRDCQCEYGYSDTWQPIATDSSLQMIVREMTKHIVEITGDTSLNCCNLNYYPAGGGVGYHADDEFLFDSLRRPTRIISMSLCSNEKVVRKFQVRRQQETDEDDLELQNDAARLQDDDSVYETLLGHGDIMTMEGMFQRHYFHSIWPGDSKDFQNHPWSQGERINLTWRTIVQHLDGSEECRGKTCPKQYRKPPTS